VCSHGLVNSTSRLRPLVRMAAVCALAGISWMHGATPSMASACMSHEAMPVVSSTAHASTDPHASSALPAVPPMIAMDQTTSSGFVVSNAEDGRSPGGTVWMTCVAILVALLVLASAPTRSKRWFRLHRHLGRIQALSVQAWPKPPDLMELSVLRT